MIKLNKQIESLEAIIERIDAKIEEYEEKKEAIIDHASELDRDMTDSEYNKIDKLDEKIEELEEERDAVQNAIDYIIEYAD